MVATASTTSTEAPRDARTFLESVQAWQWQLAHRFSRRTRLDAEELFQELVLDVLEHFHYYDAARGAPTTFTMLRARAVVQELTRRRRCRVRLVAVSQLPACADEFDEDFLTSAAVARPDPDADAGRLEREEDVAELRRVVGEAVACLTEGQGARLAAYYGLGGAEGPVGMVALGAADGVTNKAISQSVRLARGHFARDERLRALAERHGLTLAAG